MNNRPLEVPLFIDNYGKKRYLKDFTQFGELIEVPVNLDTPIVHVTHSQEKRKIRIAKEFVASDNKNIIPGIWFSPESQLGDPKKSVYGNWAFPTTLRKLGVSGIRQGEIVSYKKEVNFIVYASDTECPNQPNMATKDSVEKLMKNKDAYPAVSIFVPECVLPSDSDSFWKKVGEPYEIVHGDFCVKEKRGVIDVCPHLSKS